MVQEIFFERTKNVVRPIFKPRPELPVMRCSSSRLFYEWSKVYYEKEYASLREISLCLFLKNDLTIASFIVGGVGSATSTVVSIGDICRAGLISGCTGAVLVHNHPSGKLIPSIPDKAITEKLTAAFTLLDIQMYDHIIVSTDDTNQGYYSFADEGVLPNFRDKAPVENLIKSCY